MAVDTKEERHVWELLTRDFRAQLPADLRIAVLDGSDASTASRLQVFEVIVAAIFARLRPDYEWQVTPNRPDGGLDFIGRHRFLEDEALGITAAITVGGQCKKRGRVNDIVGELAGSLARMSKTIDPTFFVVALSARLNRERVDAAREILEESYRRHCHILDRRQIEGLIFDHLSVVEEILRIGLSDEEVGDVLSYFDSYVGHDTASSVNVVAPDRVLGGIPFSVNLDIRSARAGATRLWWRPCEPDADGHRTATLIGPIGADGPAGVDLSPEGSTDDPMRRQCSIELVTYAVGKVGLGEVLAAREESTVDADWVDLGAVQVIENVRPRFFDRPFRDHLVRLASAYDRALAAGVASISVVGAGGSGKSRLCEEFAMERRRRGSRVVAARQAKTLDDPHRLLVDLFTGLTEESPAIEDAADHVVQEIARYDQSLAKRAEPAIRSIFATGERRSGAVAEQSIISALLLLILTRAGNAPLIIHLQDLHWCTADVLLLLEKLVWQLEQTVQAPQSHGKGVLFIFEGRIREQQRLGEDGWNSEPFEAFLKKLDCGTVTCSSFEPEQSQEFVHRLFEDQYSARKLVSKHLLELQRELIERIDRTAGGNPFHSLEQVQLLKERHVLGQNPETGLLYLIQPDSRRFPLPDSIFESIQLRWQYMKARMPDLALLVWGLALLEDRVSTALFRHLWREIAPTVSLADIQATDWLWTGEGEEREVAFRHENYFRSLRRFEVTAEERERVVAGYSGWFEGVKRPGPADQFRWARALLELPEPDVAGAGRLLRSAARRAQQLGDLPLARRILTTSLDLTWNEDNRLPLRSSTYLRRCDDELMLVRDLLGSDRLRAGERIMGAKDRIGARLASGRTRSAAARDELQRRQLTIEVLESQYLFNDRRPAKAAAIAAKAVRGVEALRPNDVSAADEIWLPLEMEALYSSAVALALSGEIDEALETSERAIAIARRLSSPLGRHVICTHAAILLAKDPVAAESILRNCLEELDTIPDPGAVRDEAEINLSMALILRAHEPGRKYSDETNPMLAEARALSMRVFAGCFQIGQYPDAGAAALLLGIICALEENGDEVSWFAQAVAAASRGRHMETLWRSHIDLATAMFRKGEPEGDGVRNHALAAVEIMEETLSPYPEPDRSARFNVLRSPLVQATRYLLLAGDDVGLALLERYPALRAGFEDVKRPTLREDRGGPHHYQWLRIDQEDYILY